MSGGNLFMDDLRPYFDQLGRRLESLEAQMALVSKEVGLTYTPLSAAVPAEVVELARAGKTLEAMKAYRALTGADATEAKQVVAGL